MDGGARFSETVVYISSFFETKGEGCGDGASGTLPSTYGGPAPAPGAALRTCISSLSTVAVEAVLVVMGLAGRVGGPRVSHLAKAMSSRAVDPVIDWQEAGFCYDDDLRGMVLSCLHG